MSLSAEEINLLIDELSELIDEDVRLTAAMHGVPVDKHPRRRQARSMRDNIDEQFEEAKKRGLPVVEVKDGIQRRNNT